MDESGFNLTELTELIRSYLASKLPSLAWEKHFKGAAIPNRITGTVSADSMEFSNTAKGADVAMITFHIYIIDPRTENRLEKIALDVRRAFKENDTLDDVIQSGMVEKIEFGAVTANAGACLITYKVKLWM